MKEIIRAQTDTLQSMNNLAVSYEALRKIQEAEQLLPETLLIQKGVLGLEHLDTLQSMNKLAIHIEISGKQEKKSI